MLKREDCCFKHNVKQPPDRGWAARRSDREDDGCVKISAYLHNWIQGRLGMEQRAVGQLEGDL